jgi:hypothetical protein
VTTGWSGLVASRAASQPARTTSPHRVAQDGLSDAVLGSLPNGGLFVAGIALAVVVGTLPSVLKRFFRQACALECLGVIAST